MKSFTEWLTKDEDSNVSNEEESLIINQLEQYVDRIRGVLYNISEEKRNALKSKLINDLINKV